MYECLNKNYSFTYLLKEKSKNSEIENKCRKLVHYIIYAVLYSKPDLSNPVNIISRHQIELYKTSLYCIALY